MSGVKVQKTKQANNCFTITKANLNKCTQQSSTGSRIEGSMFRFLNKES